MPHSTLVGDVDRGGGGEYVGYMGTLYFPLSFCCEPKTVLRDKVFYMSIFLKKKKKGKETKALFERNSLVRRQTGTGNMTLT